MNWDDDEPGYDWPMVVFWSILGIVAVAGVVAMVWDTVGRLL